VENARQISEFDEVGNAIELYKINDPKDREMLWKLYFSKGFYAVLIALERKFPYDWDVA
jgi:hypothetical protein